MSTKQEASPESVFIHDISNSLVPLLYAIEDLSESLTVGATVSEENQKAIVEMMNSVQATRKLIDLRMKVLRGEMAK